MRCPILITAALSVSPAAAAADLIAVEIRESIPLNNEASGLVGQDARVLRLFAIFDQPGLVGENPLETRDPNELTTVVNLEAFTTTLSLSRGVFYQNPFGSARAPAPALIEFFPALAFDSYVSFGGIIDDPADPPDEDTNLTPDFDWTDPTKIAGGWFARRPGRTDKGNAALDEFGRFSVFFAQFTIVGAGATPSGKNDLLAGFGGPGVPATIQFGVRDFFMPSVRDVPVTVTVIVPAAPGAAVFMIAGALAFHRCRRAA